ncbi:Histone-binding protein MSI1 [Diplonema papillatum]|nr:Histone-binding protein MSI1 [Diplonema papillatum]
MTSQYSWHAIAPWMYQYVVANQLDAMTSSLDWECAAGSAVRKQHLLTTTNHVAGHSSEGSTASAVLVLELDLPVKGEPVQEFAEDNYAAPRYANRVLFKTPIVRARWLRKAGSPGVAAVKCTDGIALADVRQQSALSAIFPLASKRPKVAGQKSAALACQPKGTIVAFTDYANGDHGVEGKHNLLTWDAQFASLDTVDHPKQVLLSVEKKIEDIAFSELDPTTLFSASDDGYMRVSDLRSAPGSSGREMIAPQSMPLRSVSACPVDRNVVFCGGKEAMLVFDLRVTGRGPVAVLDHGGKEVSRVAAHPHDPALVASCSSDGRLWVWDLSLSPCHPTPQVSEASTPPELLFVHSGHQPMALTDLTWCPSPGHPHVIASSDASGALHVFSPRVLHVNDEEEAERAAHGIVTPKGVFK